MLFMVGAIGYGVQAPSSELGKIDLEQAKKYAIGHNYEIQALAKEVEESRARITRARANYYPKLGVVGGGDSYMQENNGSSSAVGMLAADLNLFSGFSDSNKLSISQLQAERAEIKLERAKFRTGLEVEFQFHLFLFKKLSIELLNDALKLNEQQQKMAKQKRSAGIASDSDVLEFDLRESLLNSDLHSVKQELEESRTNLKRLLGEEIGSKIEPVGDLQHQHITVKLMDLINRIKQESESVLTAEKNLAIANLESIQWRSQWLPRVDIQGRAGYLPWDMRQGPPGLAAAVGIYARIDLFSGFDSIAERREGMAKLQGAEASLKNAILSAVTQTEIAYRKIITVQDRVDLESKNLERAKKYYDIVLSEYRRGIKNSMDLKVAAENLYNTKQRRNGYKFEFLSQRIELERALGGPVPCALEEEH